MIAPDLLLCAPRQHLPRGEEFLFLPPWIQPYAYRNVDKLFAHRVIRRGPAPRPLPYGPEIDPRYTAASREYDVVAPPLRFGHLRELQTFKCPIPTRSPRSWSRRRQP